MTINDILRANPDAPKTGRQAVELAKKLFIPAKMKMLGGIGMNFAFESVHLDASEQPEAEFCGEYSRGLLDLALASDLIEPADKDEIHQLLSDAQPSFEKTKTINHFRFAWTEVSADGRDNVTEADIDATGAELNDLYDRYSAQFRPPQADLIGGVRLIDVDVYYDPTLFGSTTSFSNKIFLNSRDVVRDFCRRRTTSAHELFHRVQYAYGYTTGTAGQRWWVEALGSWAQKHAYPGQHDYVQRVISGLNQPVTGLLTRSYDACHFWKYLGERLVAHGTQPSEFEAIKAFMAGYDSNGHDSQQACRSVVIPLNAFRPFDSFFSTWALANFSKDFVGVPDGYNDNSVQLTNCGRVYGPYPRIMPVSDSLILSDVHSFPTPVQSVNLFGTSYHRYRMDPSVTSVKVRFVGNPNGGDAEFAVGMVKAKNDQWRQSLTDIQAGQIDWTFNVAAEDFNELVVVVSALSGVTREFFISINP